MREYTLSHVSDDELIAGLAALVATERQTMASLLAHLAEVDAREPYLPAACSSMDAYCLRVLHLADDAALKRIRAARIARRYPQIFEMIADGRLHLSGVVMLAPHLTDKNVDGALAAATHRSKADIEMLVARIAPEPDRPTTIVPIDAPQEILPAPQVAPGPPPVAPPVTHVKPLAPERFALQVTISGATREKLERAQALLRHSNPSGELAEVIDRAVDALLIELERKKFAATSRPRAKKARGVEADPRYVPSDVKRDVHERDGEQCTFVSADGVRCTERGFLERDHSTPVALGGKPTVDEIRMLCRAHNQYEAERRLGVDFMRAKREAARASRAVRAATVAEGQPSSVVSTDGVDAASFDADVTNALRGLGFKTAEARRAVEQTAGAPASTIEERLRAALAVLPKANRCLEGAVRYRAGEGAPWRTWH